MWDSAASPRGLRHTLTQAVRLIVVVLSFIMKTLNYFQIKNIAFKCLSYWSSKIQKKCLWKDKSRGNNLRHGSPLDLLWFDHNSKRKTAQTECTTNFRDQEKNIKIH